MNRPPGTVTTTPPKRSMGVLVAPSPVSPKAPDATGLAGGRSVLMRHCNGQGEPLTSPTSLRAAQRRGAGGALGTKPANQVAPRFDQEMGIGIFLRQEDEEKF